MHDAAGHLAAMFWLHHQQSPLHLEGLSILHAFACNLFSTFANTDPPKKLQWAITPKLLHAMYKLSIGLGSDPNSCFVITTDLVGSEFFYATWSCEISMTPKPGKTKILDLDSITFHDKVGLVIPHDDPDLHLAF